MTPERPSSPGYELVERYVSPSKLLLDPDNPRLKKDRFERLPVDVSRVADVSVQASLLARICEDEHAVKPLMSSIRNQGFVALDSMLAKRVDGTDLYIVLEGNRRTAAIKKLLENPAQLSRSVLKTLNAIKVKELICEDEDRIQEIVDSIVALRHISGPKDWQPMQRAYAIFTAYERQFSKKARGAPLYHSANTTQEVAFMLGQSQAKVKEEVAIFSIFLNLQRQGYLVRSDHYSLIQLLVGKPIFASEYFDVNRLALTISPLGAERFNELCIKENCAIKNPKDFRSLYRIFKDGNESDLNLIATGARSLENLLGDIRDRLRGSRFLDNSTKILAALESMRVSDFNETDEEAQLIVRIKGLVDRRLWPLAAKYLDLD